jgi:hypothetical protein
MSGAPAVFPRDLHRRFSITRYQFDFFAMALFPFRWRMNHRGAERKGRGRPEAGTRCVGLILFLFDSVPLCLYGSPSGRPAGKKRTQDPPVLPNPRIFGFVS